MKPLERLAKLRPRLAHRREALGKLLTSSPRILAHPSGGGASGSRSVATIASSAVNPAGISVPGPTMHRVSLERGPIQASGMTIVSAR